MARRYATQQINYAYAAILSSQFQAFCRDLHSESVDYLVTVVPAALQDTIKEEFFLNRTLDRGNPHPGGIGSDFNRLGVDFWPEVYALHAANHRRRELLQELIECPYRATCGPTPKSGENRFYRVMSLVTAARPAAEADRGHQLGCVPYNVLAGRTERWTPYLGDGGDGPPRPNSRPGRVRSLSCWNCKRKRSEDGASYAASGQELFR